VCGCVGAAGGVPESLSDAVPISTPGIRDSKNGEHTTATQLPTITVISYFLLIDTVPRPRNK
jgi:hypothetical protein